MVKVVESDREMVLSRILERPALLWTGPRVDITGVTMCDGTDRWDSIPDVWGQDGIPDSIRVEL